MTNPIYILKLNLPAELPEDIRLLYHDAVLSHNKNIYENPFFDAGF